MLNYIKSEWYRQMHNKPFKIMVLVCMGLIAALVGVLAYFGSEPGFRYANTRFAMSMIFTSMSGVFVLTMVPASFMENNAKNKELPIKNSVAFGISRETIYLGKFIVQLILCTLMYLLLPAFLTLLSYLFLEHSGVGETEYMIRALTGAFPLCLFMLSICFCFFFNMGTSMVPTLWILGIVYVIPKSLSFLSLKFAFFGRFTRWFPSEMLRLRYDESGLHFFWDTADGLLRCYTAGIIGTLVFLLVGMYWLKKREIK